MKIYYYLKYDPLYDKRGKLELEMVKNIYKDKVEIVYGEMNNKLELFQNNVLFTRDIYRLSDEGELTELNDLVVAYKKLLDNNIIIRFEESPQCNSEHIYSLMKALDVSGWENFKKILVSGINSYKIYKLLDGNYRRKHVITAKINGHQLGNRKGAKLVTKKSIEMKEKIKNMCEDFDGNMKDIDVRNELGLAKNTYFKYKKEIKEERNKQ